MSAFVLFVGGVAWAVDAIIIAQSNRLLAIACGVASIGCLLFVRKATQ